MECGDVWICKSGPSYAPGGGGVGGGIMLRLAGRQVDVCRITADGVLCHGVGGVHACALHSRGLCRGLGTGYVVVCDGATGCGLLERSAAPSLQCLPHTGAMVLVTAVLR